MTLLLSTLPSISSPGSGLGIKCPLALPYSPVTSWTWYWMPSGTTIQSCYSNIYCCPSLPQVSSTASSQQCIHNIWVAIPCSKLVAVLHKTALPLPLGQQNLPLYQQPAKNQKALGKSSATGRRTPRIRKRRQNLTQNHIISQHPRRWRK